MPPIMIMTGGRTRIYNRVQDLKRMGVWTKEGEGMIKKEEEILMGRQWEIYLGNPALMGKKTTELILPNFRGWLGCEFNEVNFWTTQILTGHGCFGEYLAKIQKVENARCEECKRETDTVRHTVERCEAWTEERRGLREDLGMEVNLDELIKGMIERKEVWDRASLYLTQIMKEKWRRERDRQSGRRGSVNSPSIEREASPRNPTDTPSEGGGEGGEG